MQISFKKINIESPTPTTQCGHIQQTYVLDEYHDHLYCRALGLKDDNNWIIHLSFDLLSFRVDMRNELQDYVRKYYKNNNIHLITSSTHTHYANNPSDEKYKPWLLNKLKKEISTMDYKEYQNVETSYQKLHTKTLGKSRISGYETENEYLCIIKFFENNNNFLNIIINNCHPTILKAETKFFSSEYPGYILKKLEEKYPNSNFTFIQGAAGDISTRFTRSGQDYDALIELSDKFLVEVNKLMDEDIKHIPLKLEYNEKVVEYEHDFTPLDLSKVRDNLTEREKETIEYGLKQREKYLNPDMKDQIFSVVSKEAIVAGLDIGSIKIIFFPNEIFSEYLNELELDTKILVSYSNGYGPYVLPIDFKYITYEMIMDTLTKKTKQELIETFKTI